MSKKKDVSLEETTASRDPLARRLDAVIRLLIEMNKTKPKNAEEFTEGDAARLLKSVDLTPTEIAKILGKKSRTDVTYCLYGKKTRSEPNDEHNSRQEGTDSALESQKKHTTEKGGDEEK